MGTGDDKNPPSPSQPTVTTEVNAGRPTPKFDPSRMIGIIRRKALIKDLAAVYHAECLAYCQELLEVQSKWEQVNVMNPCPTNSQGLRKDVVRPTKRVKKGR